MRVLMVVRPAAGGMKEHVLALSTGLARSDHQVEIAAPPGSDIAEAAYAAGFLVHEIPLVGPLHPMSDPKAIMAVKRIVRPGHFDVVHAHGFKAGLVARLGVPRVRGRRVPVVVTAHNHVLFRDDTLESTRRRYRLVERALSGRAARYIAVSDSIRRELVEGYGLPATKVVTVRNGVEPSAFLELPSPAAAREALGLPTAAGALVVGLAARFSAQKGLAHLIAAVPALRDGARELGRELVVVIGGSGPLEAELRAQAAALGVAELVRWPGFVESVPTLLAALDVYVSPAETEALGIALIEAALAGVPTVATRVGGVPEVVIDGETGLLVAPKDPAALAEAALSLARDPERAHAFAVAAQARCLAEFSPERMLAETIEVYRGVTGSGPGGREDSAETEA